MARQSCVMRLHIPERRERLGTLLAQFTGHGGTARFASRPKTRAHHGDRPNSSLPCNNPDSPKELSPHVQSHPGDSPLVYAPNVPNIGLWRIVSIAGDCVQFTGKTAYYTYYQDFSVQWQHAGESTVKLNGYECPGQEIPSVTLQVPITAFFPATITVMASASSFQVRSELPQRTSNCRNEPRMASPSETDSLQGNA